MTLVSCPDHTPSRLSPRAGVVWAQDYHDTHVRFRAMVRLTGVRKVGAD